MTKHFLAHEMERGCKASGVKRIRIHDIRHSHVGLLIEMGFSALLVSIYFSPFSPTYFRQSRQRACAAFGA